jgi:hypothetical protein
LNPQHDNGACAFHYGEAEHLSLHL